MIKVENVTKIFENYTAVDGISLNIGSSMVYGLVGTNGSGKSTLLRIISGVYKSESGNITIDDENVWENPSAKEKVFFVCDDLFFFQHATINTMAEFYKSVYPNWSTDRFEKLCHIFPLGKDKKISTFSKGMKRQAALILAISSSPQYLLLDEAFDGLDPVIRFAVRRVISDIISQNNVTVVISSHNLRELEDFCNMVCLIHKGKLIFECDMDNLNLQFAKVQVVLKEPASEIPNIGIRVLSSNIKGSIITFVCEGSESDILSAVSKLNPILAETVPLNLEEVFIYEMEAVGYDYKNIIF